MKRIQTGLLLLLGLFVAAPALQAQYFGRNKPRYENFDFKVYETPHFEIYHYLPDSARVREVADWCEQWYAAHQNVLKDTIQFKNPLILYNDHADFQQTNAISGLIGVGTGGVTEALKNIRQATDQTASGTSQLEKAAMSLNTLSEQLRNAVARYRL